MEPLAELDPAEENSRSSAPGAALHPEETSIFPVPTAAPHEINRCPTPRKHRCWNSPGGPTLQQG